MSSENSTIVDENQQDDQQDQTEEGASLLDSSRIERVAFTLVQIVVLTVELHLCSFMERTFDQSIIMNLVL